MNNQPPTSQNHILHIVNKSGGGTIRYIESLVYSPASQFKHFIWYVGENQSIFFDVAANFYYAYSADLSSEKQHQIILAILNKNDVKELGIHLHSTFGAGLFAAEQWLQATQKTNSPKLTVTFHDHHFLAEKPFHKGTLAPDQDHIARIQRLLKNAEIILPSEYLLQQATAYFAHKQLHVIPHGIEAPIKNLSPETIDFINSLKQRANWDNDALTVATIGAISEDKGLAFMKGWLEQRNADTQFLCLGYTADAAADKNRPTTAHQQITHGFYHHKEVPELLKAYKVDLIIFFPGIAESFCYALSDINAQVTVLAPDNGALGERVKNENLGTVYPHNITPDALNHQINQLNKLNITNQYQPQSIENMTLETEKTYRLYEPSELLALSLTSEELSEILADQLHDDNLKWELATLVRQNDSANQQAQFLKNEIEKQAHYISQLQQDIHESQDQLVDLDKALKLTIKNSEEQIKALKNTLSWKITKPIRAIRKRIK